MNNEGSIDFQHKVEPESRSSSFRKSFLGSKVSALASALSVDAATLTFCCCLAAVLVAFFLFMIKPFVFLRADLLMWEETDFISNIIKLNIGAPLYTAPSDSNSLIYNPLSFLLTYAIAWPVGLTKSVVGLRIIQLVYVCLAAVLATACCRNLRRLAFPKREIQNEGLWTVLTFLAMFLAATSPYVNRFVHTLHVDALSLLISVISFWAMLRYAEKASIGNLALMAVCPAVGFLTKQFLISWIGVMLVFLLLIEPKNLKHLGTFFLLSSGFALLAFLLCYAVWGDNYIFWTVEIMGGERKAIFFSPDSYSISISRGIDHVVRAWPEIFVGVIGGWFLLKWGEVRKVGPLVAAWVVLLATEGFSSGAGWSVLYHFGPGILIGAIFMFTVLPQLWERVAGEIGSVPRVVGTWVNAAFMTAAIIAIFSAWHVVPTGDKSSPRYVRGISSFDDVERYVSEIESEFTGLKTEKVLLGVGSWIYLRDDVLQRDRAVALGDQPFGGIYENFDITLNRLRNGTYEKILVQDFHSPYFLYDWSDWPRPSGFRAALSENYVEVRVIEPPKGATIPLHILNAGPVSVFVRRN
jgi:hypothetical protein